MSKKEKYHLVIPDFPAEVIERLREYARSERRSVGAQVGLIIENFLNAKKGAAQK